MRVAMLAADPTGPDGWGRYTRDLVIALSKAGVEIVLITATNAAPDPDLPLTAYHRLLPSVTTTPATRAIGLKCLAAIPVVWRVTRDCDVFHVTTEPYAIAVPDPSRLIVTAHGTYLPKTMKHWLWGGLYRRAYRRATVICVSQFTEKQVCTAIPDLPTVVIPNGVDATRYSQKPIHLPEKSGPTILAVGYLKARKGYHILAAAMRQIRGAVPDAQAVFIGSTEDTQYCEALRAQLQVDGLTEAVHILGRVDEETLLGWYHTADVFAVPSININGKFEGFGLIYLEASAAGLPVIGTLDCGAEDAIIDGQTGYLIPQNDSAILAEKIIGLLQNPDQRKRMGAAGIAFARQHTWDQIAARVIELYQKRL